MTFIDTMVLYVKNTSFIIKVHSILEIRSKLAVPWVSALAGFFSERVAMLGLQSMQEVRFRTFVTPGATIIGGTSSSQCLVRIIGMKI